MNLSSMFLAENLPDEIWLKLVFTMLCSGVLGLERQFRGKPVGIRTSALISLATLGYMVIAQVVSNNNSEHMVRVIGQIVTGVGFLGGGVMFTHGSVVTGVTSAAVIWLLAACSIAVGVSQYGLALLLCFTGVSILMGVEYIEHLSVAMRQGVYMRIDKVRNKDKAQQ